MAAFGAATTGASHLDGQGGGIGRLQAQREKLTATLRATATRLDEAERLLSDLAGPRPQRPADAGTAGAIDRPPPQSADLAALESRRRRLHADLREMARQLTDLDRALSALKGYQQWTPDRVGVCPQCGYPSLGSGLCAYCRPFLVG